MTPSLVKSFSVILSLCVVFTRNVAHVHICVCLVRIELSV